LILVAFAVIMVGGLAVSSAAIPNSIVAYADSWPKTVTYRAENELGDIESTTSCSDPQGCKGLSASNSASPNNLAKKNCQTGSDALW
jgi:hypothetical protein